MLFTLWEKAAGDSSCRSVVCPVLLSIATTALYIFEYRLVSDDANPGGAGGVGGGGAGAVSVVVVVVVVVSASAADGRSTAATATPITRPGQYLFVIEGLRM
jgi:hypothetical protein